MRTMKRNKQTFYYALFDSQTALCDEYGNETGEYKTLYCPFVQEEANISAASGTSQAEQFGTSVQYDKVIVLDDLNCPIDENSVLCIDIEPAFDKDGNPLYDYVVKRIAKSLNSVSIAISKVKVS